jgi:hypothetical protein
MTVAFMEDDLGFWSINDFTEDVWGNRVHYRDNCQRKTLSRRDAESVQAITL